MFDLFGLVFDLFGSVWLGVCSVFGSVWLCCVCSALFALFLRYNFIGSVCSQSIAFAFVHRTVSFSNVQQAYR